jgi:TPR repeat protein
LNFVFRKLSILFSGIFEPFLHIGLIKRAVKTAGRKDRKQPRKTVIPKAQNRADELVFKQGSIPMARFEISTSEMATMGGDARAEVFCDMGLMYATGRGVEIDLVSAHKWLNIAAIKGSDRAAELRADLAVTMSKMQLAEALRAAREWMTMH